MSRFHPPQSSANAAAVASLERRRRRSLILLVCFIVLMPLGCVGPCSLTPLLPNETARMGAGITALVLPLIGFGGTILMFSDSRKYKSGLRAVAAADDLGLAFVEKPKKNEYAVLEQARMFRDATIRSCGYLLHGDRHGVPVLLADFHAVYGFGKYATVSSQTVVVVPADLPDFLVSAKSWLNFLEKLVGDRQIDFSDAPTFHKNFIVRSDGDVDEIRDALTPTVRRMLVVDPTLVIEIHNGHLFVTRFKRIQPPDKYAESIDEAFRFAEALHPAS